MPQRSRVARSPDDKCFVDGRVLVLGLGNAVCQHEPRAPPASLNLMESGNCKVKVTPYDMYCVAALFIYMCVSLKHCSSAVIELGGRSLRVLGAGGVGGHFLRGH